MLHRILRNKVGQRSSGLFNFLRVRYYCDKSSKEESRGDVSLGEQTVSDEPTKDDQLKELGSEGVSKLLNEAATFSDADDKSWATSPYPVKPKPKPETPAIDPKTMSVVMFPGQGILKVGSVKKYLRFPGARDLFEIANDVLGFDLLKICMEGPREKFNMTQYNQLATVVTSLAALEQLREERPEVFQRCIAAAGFSVGELTALIFSGVISLEDGIRLVAVRGTAMQKASQEASQGMMSVFCTPKAKLSVGLKEAEAWAQDLGVSYPVCRVAIYMYTQGKVIAGNTEALDYIKNNSDQIGVRKVTRVPVSGAFHTPLMNSAVKPFGKALDTLRFDEPRTKIYSNYNALPYPNSTFVKKYLLKQLTYPVKWEQTLQTIFQRPQDKGFPRSFDVASEGRLKAILSLINAKASNLCIVI